MGDRARVGGVLLADGTRLRADLVVDATGRGSRQGEWLRALGALPPPKRRVHLDLGYATALFHRSPASGSPGCSRCTRCAPPPRPTPG